MNIRSFFFFLRCVCHLISSLVLGFYVAISDEVCDTLPKPAVPNDTSTEGVTTLVQQLKFCTSSRDPSVTSGGLFVDPVSKEVCDTLPKPAVRNDISTAGFTHLVPRRSLCTLPNPAPKDARRSYSCAPTLVPHLKFCTSSRDPSVTSAGHDTVNDIGNRLRFHIASPHNIGFGNSEKLCSKITGHIDGMRARVLKFKELYNEFVRPVLVSRCLIAPGALNDPLTAFLHNQTYRITKHNASYMSCFDIMAFRSMCEDAEEWDNFITYLTQKKIYVIEDWLKSYSTIETLMYDHGLKQPDDGTEEPFYKGECDASYDNDTGIATLSYILWKDRKIIYAEVFKSVPCKSSVEAEIHAVMSLLYKCEELNIQKLQVWSDSRTATSILSGELPIGMEHQQRDFFLMLRGMRSRFKSLVVTWRPRELMVFADFLATAAKLENNDPYSILKHSLTKFYSHLRGSPVLRIERTVSTTKAVKKFGNVTFSESYARSGSSRYLIEVDEDSKFEVLLGLNQSLEPVKTELFIGNRGEENLNSLKKQLETMDQKLAMVKSPIGESPSVAQCTLIHKEAGHSSKTLVVLYDYSVAEHVANTDGEFQVVLVTPSERRSMKDKIEELTALGFVYFNGVRLPVNEKRK